MSDGVSEGVSEGESDGVPEGECEGECDGGCEVWVSPGWDVVTSPGPIPAGEESAADGDSAGGGVEASSVGPTSRRLLPSSGPRRSLVPGVRSASPAELGATTPGAVSAALSLPWSLPLRVSIAVPAITAVTATPATAVAGALAATKSRARSTMSSSPPLVTAPPAAATYAVAALPSSSGARIPARSELTSVSSR